MAYLRIEYFSNALHRTADFEMLIPNDPREGVPPEKNEDASLAVLSGNQDATASSAVLSAPKTEEAATAVEPAIRSLLFRVTNTDQDIGEDLIIPQLYGKIYQAAGEYASTFAITSMQVSGSFGTKTDKVEVPWNNKVNLNNSDTDVVIVVSE